MLACSPTSCSSTATSRQADAIGEQVRRLAVPVALGSAFDQLGALALVEGLHGVPDLQEALGPPSGRSGRRALAQGPRTDCTVPRAPSPERLNIATLPSSPSRVLIVSNSLPKALVDGLALVANRVGVAFEPCAISEALLLDTVHQVVGLGPIPSSRSNT